MEPTIYKPSIYKGTGIYNTGAGGGGGGAKLGILDNFKFSLGDIDASRPIIINNGIFSVGNNSCQFSPISTFDISTAENLKIKLRLKIDQDFYTSWFLSNWYGTGERFQILAYKFLTYTRQIPPIVPPLEEL